MHLLREMCIFLSHSLHVCNMSLLLDGAKSWRFCAWINQLGLSRAFPPQH